MKLEELVRRVGEENIGVQVLHESICGIRQRKGYVEVTVATECVTPGEVARGQWDNIVLITVFKRKDYEKAVEDSKNGVPIKRKRTRRAPAPESN